MKRHDILKCLSIFTAIIFGFYLLAGCSDSRVKTDRVVIIALDGISIEGYNTAKHPNIDRIANDGAISMQTRVVMPSITLPNFTSHLTGSGPEQHGVVNNNWFLDNHELPPVEKDSKGYFPSIFKVLKDQVPDVKTAFYYNWAKLIEPYNQDYIDEPSYEAEDGYRENYKKAFDFIVKNRDIPTFVFLYSVHTDHAGHRHGWMTPEYISSIEEADVLIGEFLDKMEAEGLYKNTHIIFLSDHGGINKGHGGVSTTEMIVPWSIAGPGIKKGYDFKEPNNTVNTAATVAWLFGCEQPLSWVGQVPASIFE